MGESSRRERKKQAAAEQSGGAAGGGDRAAVLRRLLESAQWGLPLEQVPLAERLLIDQLLAAELLERRVRPAESAVMLEPEGKLPADWLSGEWATETVFVLTDAGRDALRQMAEAASKQQRQLVIGQLIGRQADRQIGTTAGRGGERDAERTAAATGKRAGGEWERLSDRARDCLQALWEAGAESIEQRLTAVEVAERVEGKGAEPAEYKQALAELVQRGLVYSRQGRSGGYWLGAAGKKLLRRLHRPR